MWVHHGAPSTPADKECAEFGDCAAGLGCAWVLRRLELGLLGSLLCSLGTQLNGGELDACKTPIGLGSTDEQCEVSRDGLRVILATS